ncbi:DnaA/Hda family protein [Lichenihabitans sp. Uapishka_5]|uniref:HdaA/DnaA family protein n=1 Tax=Lichenihabitans sp. Uapishka_5 TaxID=3037302 RepID=UPI0029E7EEF8|nr:DnaA/Hda family protein [Lichenihabitans sp. Uapishka_5]MDX7949646.1 DnaA/Hda family protein [Lichenihabitans sp. Uapishka_5]
MHQIPLDLAGPPRFGADDYLVAAANQDAFEAVGHWPVWPGHVLVLVGPEGAGKSHLGAIWADRARAAIVTGAGLAATPPELFGRRDVLVEDADRLGADEAALFHRLNLLRENGRAALLTARTAPDNWGLRTADLLSRLRLAPLVRLGEPDEAFVQAVLLKLFADRQLSIDAPVLAFLSRHMERSLGAARRLVAALDHASLAEGRRITRTVAAAVLASLEARDASGHGVVTGLGHNPADP